MPGIMMSSSTRSGGLGDMASLRARSPLLATVVSYSGLSKPFISVRFSGVSSTMRTVGCRFAVASRLMRVFLKLYAALAGGATQNIKRGIEFIIGDRTLERIVAVGAE